MRQVARPKPSSLGAVACGSGGRAVVQASNAAAAARAATRRRARRATITTGPESGSLLIRVWCRRCQRRTAMRPETAHDNRAMKTIRLRPGRERSLQRGHPWVFEGAIERGKADAGETVRVEASDGRFLA